MAEKADSGIYEIVNLVNGKRYVGSAISFAGRWKEHLRRLRKNTHHSRHLQRSWNRHGERSFEFRVLERCDRLVLIIREQAAIDFYRPEYNISRTAGSTLGVKYTPESRARVSAALKGNGKGRIRDRASVDKTAAAHRGTKRSEETRANISRALTGTKKPPRSNEYRIKISTALNGKPKTAEHLAKLQSGRATRVYTEDQKIRISEALRLGYAQGRRSRDRPPQYRAKIAATLTGKTLTKEHRANVSAAMLGKKRGPYKLNPEKAEGKRESGRRLAAMINAKRWGARP